MWAGLYFFFSFLLGSDGPVWLCSPGSGSDSSSLTGSDRTGLTRRIMQDELALRLTRWSRSGRLP